jgi:hypothetical protein
MRAESQLVGLGYWVGGTINDALVGVQHFVVGLPGFASAIVRLTIREPVRGTSERPSQARQYSNR